LNFAIGEAVIRQLMEVSRGKTLIAVTHDERLGKYFDCIIDMNEMTDGRRDTVTGGELDA
jgi:ABC-type lipoprotein export system ATPase subunit